MKYELSINFLKQNFNYKNFCDDINFAFKNEILDYPLDTSILNHSIFKKVGKYMTSYESSKVDKEEEDWWENSEKVEEDFFSEKNKTFYNWFIKERNNGQLLPKLNNNFKLIYNLNIGNIFYSLIFSKFNKTYYFFETWDNYNIIRYIYSQEPTKKELVILIKKILKDSDPELDLEIFEDYFENFFQK